MSRNSLVLFLCMLIGFCQYNALGAGAIGLAIKPVEQIVSVKLEHTTVKPYKVQSDVLTKKVGNLNRIKRTSRANFNYDKYPNAFWKIGGLLLQAGIVVAGLTSSFVVSLSYGFTSIWFLIILLGLALMLLSLPFLLVGYILGSKKPSEPDDFY